MRRQKKGVITVFLSLILLGVLAVILTTLESARLYGGHVMAERAMDTAMDSLLAEYYAPLFKRYHIFGLDAGFGSKDADYTVLAEKLKDYMDNTFQPDRDMEELPIPLPAPLGLYGIETVGVNIASTRSLSDLQGELFVKQACEYMKYKVPESALNNLLKEFNIVEGMKETGEILNLKQETEEAAAELEGGVLKLMEAVDGFAVNKQGVITEGKDVKIRDNFVKKLWTGSINKTSLGIENDWLFLSVRNQYVNPTAAFEGIREEINSLFTIRSSRESLQIQLNALEAIDTSGFTKEEKKKYEKKEKDIGDQVKALQETEGLKQKSLNEEGKQLIRYLSKELEAVEKAHDILTELVSTSQNVRESIREYNHKLEEYIARNKEESKSLSEELDGELDMTEPGTEGVHQYDYEGMKDCLEKNRGLLEEYLKVAVLSVNSDSSSWQSYEEELTRYEETVNSLDFDPLRFSYSGWGKPKESESFWQGINNVIKNGLSELVIEDMETIPENSIPGTELPSEEYILAKKQENSKDLASEFSLDKREAIYSPVFSSLKDSGDFQEKSLSFLNNILFLEYLEEHFGDYQNGAKEGKKVLNYEKEYILGGRRTDRENLSEMVEKIIALRSLSNTITLLADAKSREEAGALAAGFVGFTGMPALIEAVKYMVIITWGFGEALVDTAAVFSGKSIPLIKQKKNFSLALTDIFGLTKERILEKAAGYEEVKDSGYIDYNGLLKLFLLLKGREDKTYRSMDLIQENLRAEYENEFSIRNCLEGFEAEGEFSMAVKFLPRPYLAEKQEEEGVPEGYHYRIRKEYVY